MSHQKGRHRYSREWETALLKQTQAEDLEYLKWVLRASPPKFDITNCWEALKWTVSHGSLTKFAMLMRELDLKLTVRMTENLFSIASERPNSPMIDRLLEYVPESPKRHYRRIQLTFLSYIAYKKSGGAKMRSMFALHKDVLLPIFPGDALILAARRGSINKLLYLREMIFAHNQISPEIWQLRINEALSNAAQRGHIQASHLLLHWGARINSRAFLERALVKKCISVSKINKIYAILRKNEQTSLSPGIDILHDGGEENTPSLDLLFSSSDNDLPI